MIDESLDKEQMTAEPQPWEFRSKSAWQRLIVMLGGIIVNVIAGVIAMVSLTYINGDQYYSSDLIKTNGLEVMKYGAEFGFKEGDIIVNINGEDYKRLEDLTSPDIFLNDGGFYTVLRDGKEIRVDIPEGVLNKMSEDKSFRANFLWPRAGFVVKFLNDPEYLENSNAKKAGIQENDKIISVDSTNVNYWNELVDVLANSAGQVVTLGIDRAGELLSYDVAVKPDSTIGIVRGSLLKTERKEYSFGQAARVGTTEAFNLVILNAKALGKMFTGGVSARNLMGPIGIVELYPKTWDWSQFLYTTAFISMILAFMNLLPIPALDGGHVMFLLFEMISGRAPSDKFLEGAQKVGMIILLGLMVFVFGNDVLKLFGI